MNKKVFILFINLLSGATWSAKIAKQIYDDILLSKRNWFSINWYQKSIEKNSKSIYQTPPMGFCYYFWVALNFFFDIFTPRNLSIQKLRTYNEYTKSDIVHFHTMQWWYFDYRDLPLISKEKKVVWTLHDDWFCSGNDIDGSLFPYKTRRSFEKRRAIFQKSDMHVVAVSHWMYQKAIRSHLFPLDHIHLIRNGIDMSIFFPRDKMESRRILGIPEDCMMIVSIAGAWRKSNAKWIQYVERLAWEMSSDSSVQFFSLGNKKAWMNNTIHEVEFVSQEMMSLYFSSADMFLYPTQADSFGLVIAESIACGCPVITFDVWATSELVKDGKTGYLVPVWDYEWLKKAFLELQKNPIRIIPWSIPFDISVSRMTHEYMELYDQLLAD
jgi:glycosyltransferase involved in cell wall biosynthesis